MAKCERSNCDKLIRCRTSVGRQRLCEYHYQTLLRNKQHKLIKQNSVCLHCGISLENSRNSKYCCIRHRQYASRKLLNQLLTHSYWYRVESLIERSPLILASVTAPKDIADLIRLYQNKARHQRSYMLSIDDGRKPIPFFPLELAHRYPVSKGGANTALNIIITPSIINRIVSDRIPAQNQGFPGTKAIGKCLPLDGSLYDSLVKLFGSLEVTEQLGVIKLKQFHGNTPRPISFQGIDRGLPLLTLLIEELYRLDLDEWGELFMSLKRTYERLMPFMLELIAALGFYAILTGDKDRFLARLRRFNDWFLSECTHLRHPFRRGGLESFEDILLLILNKYLSKFFAIKSSNLNSVVAFYNKLFSVNVLEIGMLDEIICNSWQRGKMYRSTTSLIVPLPRRVDHTGLLPKHK